MHPDQRQHHPTHLAYLGGSWSYRKSSQNLDHSLLCHSCGLAWYIGKYWKIPTWFLNLVGIDQSPDLGNTGFTMPSPHHKLRLLLPRLWRVQRIGHTSSDTLRLCLWGCDAFLQGHSNQVQSPRKPWPYEARPFWWLLQNLLSLRLWYHRHTLSNMAWAECYRQQFPRL